MPSGGGGSSGGAIVGGPSPLAAALAGQYQSQAAAAASKQATQAVNDAINSLNTQYIGARAAVQPYATEGVQALDKLNQYLGLSAYNPGTAPVAPKLKTSADYLGKVQNSDIINYINQNTILTTAANSGGQTWGHPQYVGEGVDANTPGYSPAKTFAHGETLPAGYYSNLGSTQVGQGKQGNLGGGTGAFFADPTINAAAKNAIAQQQADQANATYDTNMQQYQQNLDAYNQNLSWYNQYQSEGPLNQAQVTANITNQPGYQAELGQGTQAINNSAGAKGYLGSGALLKELMSFGQNTLSKYYNNVLGNLQAQSQQGAQSANTIAGLQSSLGNQTASLYNGLGNTQANASLASGNALAQAVLAGNQQYQTVGGSSGGGGGLGGIGSILGGLGSIASAMPAGTFSSRDLKDKISTPSTQEILESVKNLELDVWKYKGLEGQHLGPYAQDLQAKFGIGNGQSFNLIDCVGVLFASIKALGTQIEELQAKLGSKV